MQNDQVVTASSDHGLRMYNVNTGAAGRQLFHKNFGHKEWVTTCAFLRDGRVLSGGMDSMLCLWDRRAVRCDNLTAHQGSISQVMVDEHDIGVSASYDKSLIVWDLHRQQPLTVCSGVHQAPVLTFDWHNSLLVSGDRAGVIAYWDVNTGQNLMHRPTHKGQILKILLASDASATNLVVSCGSNDGLICATDMRTHEPILQHQVHRAAINFLSMSMTNTRKAQLVITGSFDGTIKVLDAMMDFRERSSLTCTGGVLCGELMENLAIVGCQDGNINVFDTDTEECLFGYGVDNVGAVNCLSTAFNRKRLVTGGENGTALLLSFS